MSAPLPDWMSSHPDGLTAADYEALPEDISRRIEIVDGAIVVNAAPRRPHQTVSRRLATALEAALESAGGDLAVDYDIDLRLRDVPLLNRRPDLVVFDATLDDDAVLRPEHCLLVVEVMSPGSVTADQIDKPAEYASSGIAHFWRVEFDDNRSAVVYRYRFDPTTRCYALVGVDTEKLSVTDPVAVTIDLSTLIRA